ncbi:hypothetical protein GC163_23365 [bacterium]|nr:hypothetical protein [bacterium]
MRFCSKLPGILRRFCRSALCLSMAFWLILCVDAWALITGGEGNTPLEDPGWTPGAAAVFNHPSRIAYWEGPPFGGGQWHAECRGDSEALNTVLTQFAQIDTDQKRIVLHDGIGRSFWLNSNREPERKAAAAINWAFTVWQPDRLQFQQRLPVDARAVGPEEKTLAQLDIYTGGDINFSSLTLPKEIPVEDRRLEAHGFQPTDGVVWEGLVTDLATHKPLAATVILQKIEPRKSHGYEYQTVKEITADAQGHWVIKQAPVGWHRVFLKADGYVPRVIAHEVIDDQPRWSRHDATLAPSVSVSGRVLDDAGQPLSDVQVRLTTVQTPGSERYLLVDDEPLKTDAAGHFQFDAVPRGQATISLHKPGYFRKEPRASFETPAKNLEYRLGLAATLQVKIDFSQSQRPENYIVHVKAEGGERVGQWGGSGHLDANGQITFENVHPGRYVITSMPNPGRMDDETPPVTVELKGGESQKISIAAKPAR